jgi:hypothetical protein
MTSAVLLKDMVIWVRNVSAGGCLFESPTPLPIGTIGELDVELNGARRVEWFRVCRVHRVHADSGAYVFGAEFLPVAVAGGDSLRGFVGRVRPGESGGMPGLARGSSSDSGNSMAPPGTPAPSPVDPDANSLKKVVPFPRRETRGSAGSAFALAQAAHEECAETHRGEDRDEDVDCPPRVG